MKQTETTSRTAIVTGGSRGIGRAVCLELARAGINIVCNYAGNAQAAESTVEECRALGVQAISVQANVAEAAECAGISRSAFYKYRDAITPFTDLGRTRIVTFHILLRDEKGALSSLLSLLAQTGANVLTINQSIPTNGAAIVTISIQTGGMDRTVDELLQGLKAEQNIIRVEVPAG